MEVSKYNKMMSYLTRPRERFSNGGFADKLTPKEKRIVLKWGKNKGFTQKKSLEEYNKLPADQRFQVRKGKVTGKGFSTIKGTVKPLSPQDAKLFAQTNPGEVWGEGKFADARVRSNWVNDAPRKRKILNKTKGLITEKEYAKILSDALGVEIKPKKVEGKFTQGGKKSRTTFGKIAAEDFVDSFGSIKAEGSAGKFKYYKPPTQAQIKKFKTALRSPEFNQLRAPTVDAILKLHKNYEQVYREGNLPIIQDVVSKLKLKPGQAGRATARLAQIYGGHKFKNPELQNIRKNISAANKMFAKMETAPFGDVYRGGVYEAALETIDRKLGKEKGTFASLKSKARKILQDNKIKGFNINEIAGVTGSSRSGAEFSQFIDVMEENLNQKTLANLQGQLSTARAKIVAGGDFKKIADNYNLKASALESKYNVELPKLIKPGEVETSFGKKRIAELKGQGLDLVSAAKRDKYGISVPKGAMTIEEFLKPENKKTAQVLAALGCPNFKGKQVFQDGGRIGFQEGATATVRCVQAGANIVNEGKFDKLSPSQQKNLTSFLNKATPIGRTVMKFGVIPEAIWVAGASLYDMGRGAGLSEALLRGADYLLLGNQGKMADRLKFEKEVGKENADIIMRARDYKESLQQLATAKSNLETNQAVLDESDFSYTGNVDAQNQLEVDKQFIKAAEQNVKNKYQRESVLDQAVRLEMEAEDIRGTRDPFYKAMVNARSAETDDFETLFTPEKKQKGVAPPMLTLDNIALANIPDEFLEAERAKIGDAPELTKRNILDFYRTKELDDGSRPVNEIIFRELFRNARGSSANQERFFGTQGLPFGAPVINDFNIRPPRSYIQSPFQREEENRLIEEGARFGAAGGGIMKLAGIDKGPQITSMNPDSGGLDSLRKNVKKL